MIRMSFNENGFCVESGYSLTPEEKEVAAYYTNMLKIRKPETPVKVEKRASEYTGLYTGWYNFVRFKCGEKVNWIMIDPYHLPKDKTAADFWMSVSRRMWKATFKDLNDLKRYDDLVVMACVYKGEETD